jgi:ribosome-binding protein aMBF1 (putative translation factor)
MSFEIQLVQALGGLLSVTATAAIGAITPKIKKLIESHTTAKNATIANDSIDGLSKIVESVVSDFNQRIVTDVKAKGGWTPELAQQIKNDAIDAVKEQGVAFIKLSGQTAKDVEALISTLIEQAVSKAKVNK